MCFVLFFFSKPKLSHFSRGMELETYVLSVKKLHLRIQDHNSVSVPQVYEVFSVIRDLGAIAQVHAENGDIVAEVLTLSVCNER